MEKDHANAQIRCNRQSLKQTFLSWKTQRLKEVPLLHDHKLKHAICQHGVLLKVKHPSVMKYIFLKKHSQFDLMRLNAESLIYCFCRDVYLQNVHDFGLHVHRGGGVGDRARVFQLLVELGQTEAGDASLLQLCWRHKQGQQGQRGQS
jgi:hypothetical protein